MISSETIIIILKMSCAENGVHFSDIMKQVGKLAQVVKLLKELERMDYITRTVLADRYRSTIYKTTPLGAQFLSSVGAH